MVLGEEAGERGEAVVVLLLCLMWLMWLMLEGEVGVRLVGVVVRRGVSGRRVSHIEVGDGEWEASRRKEGRKEGR